MRRQKVIGQDAQSLRARRPLSWAILFFILHFLATTYAVARLTPALKADNPIENRFAPSFLVALCSIPLYPIVVGKVSFVAASLLNDLLVGFLAALMVVYLRWRTIVAIVIGVPIALLAGMIGVVMLLEQRVAAGWRDIAPRPVATGPYGKWDPIATAF